MSANKKNFRRYVVNLESRFSVEEEIEAMMKVAREGEGIGLTRTLLLIGYEELKRENRVPLLTKEAK